MTLLMWLSGAAVAGLQLDGHFEQGGMAIGRGVPEGTRVWQDGVPVDVGPGGIFLLAFPRDAAAESVLELHYPDGRTERRTLKIARRTFRIQRIDGLPANKVTPRSKAELARIRREAAAVKAARRILRRRADFLQGFIWPLTGPISGVYGSQRILNGKPRRPHYGVDIARPVGTTVVAPADGVVIFAEPDLFFSGGTLIIDHGMRLNTSYLHLSKLLVKKGDHVKRGQPIAEVGMTGRATGPHLHWGANVREVRIDPQLLVPPMPKDGA
ncbi:MAG: M23 family metallopeptidase [Gammaproteobacteria bacterium]|nr:MAG: M23 family metallopeptidase [Gammaproteobacteria bacterium]